MSKVASIVLPIAGAVLGSFIPGLGTAAGAALGGAVGGAAGQAVNGGGFGQDLMGGVMGGITGYIGGGGLGSLGNAAAPVTEAGASGAITGAADPIEAIGQAMQATGTNTATEAANALGYSSTANMLGSVNPAWVSPGAMTGAVQGAGGANVGGVTGGMGAPPTTFGGNATPAAQAQSRSMLNALTTGRSSALGPISSLMSLGSGIYGMTQSQQMNDLAKQLAATGQYSPQYAAQLNELMKNPSSINTMPGYQAGMDAVTRSMAAQGYQGSGNMAAALQQYGGNFFNNQVNQLQSLAQGGGQQLSAGIQGMNMANQSASGSLAALGYGAAGLGF